MISIFNEGALIDFLLNDKHRNRAVAFLDVIAPSSAIIDVSQANMLEKVLNNRQQQQVQSQPTKNNRKPNKATVLFEQEFLKDLDTLFKDEQGKVTLKTKSTNKQKGPAINSASSLQKTDTKEFKRDSHKEMRKSNGRSLLDPSLEGFPKYTKSDRAAVKTPRKLKNRSPPANYSSHSSDFEIDDYSSRDKSQDPPHALENNKESRRAGKKALTRNGSKEKRRNEHTFFLDPSLDGFPRFVKPDYPVVEASRKLKNRPPPSNHGSRPSDFNTDSLADMEKSPDKIHALEKEREARKAAKKEKRNARRKLESFQEEQALMNEEAMMMGDDSGDYKAERKLKPQKSKPQQAASKVQSSTIPQENNLSSIKAIEEVNKVLRQRRASKREKKILKEQQTQEMTTPKVSESQQVLPASTSPDSAVPGKKPRAKKNKKRY